MSRKKSKKPILRKVLAMTLNREPFDEIVRGEKDKEYREYKAFWRARLIGIKHEEVHFRNGYAPDATFMRIYTKASGLTGKAGAGTSAFGSARFSN